MNLEHWESQGEYQEIGGHKLFVRDSGGDKPALLLLHGYPTSSRDFHQVFPLLSVKFRVVAHDHLGFGLSDKPLHYSYSLMEQTDQALMLWQHLGIREGHVLAHDYGCSIATELVARRNRGFEPVKLRSLILCNGSIHIELAQLRLIQRLLKSKAWGNWIATLSSKKIFVRNLRRVMRHSQVISEAEWELMWQLLIHKEGKKRLPQITQYLNERFQFWHRWTEALQANRVPTLILWALQDPVAVEAIARLLHEEIEESQLILLDQLGHYPMLEAPERWTQRVLRFLEEH